MLSGNYHGEEIEHARSLGAYDFLEKGGPSVKIRIAAENMARVIKLENTRRAISMSSENE